MGVTAILSASMTILKFLAPSLGKWLEDRVEISRVKRKINRIKDKSKRREMLNDLREKIGEAKGDEKRKLIKDFCNLLDDF